MPQEQQILCAIW